MAHHRQVTYDAVLVRGPAPHAASPGATALHRWTMARRAPTRDLKVRRISSSRACVITWIGHVVESGFCRSAGARNRTRRLRGRGKTDLDLLEADAHQLAGTCAACAGSIGSTSAWLPSRRSTRHHTGAAVRHPPARSPVNRRPAGRHGTCGGRVGQHRHGRTSDGVCGVVPMNRKLEKTARVAGRAVDPDDSFG